MVGSIMPVIIVAAPSDVEVHCGMVNGLPSKSVKAVGVWLNVKLTDTASGGRLTSSFTPLLNLLLELGSEMPL